MDRQTKLDNERRAIEKVAKAIYSNAHHSISYEQARREAQKIAENHDKKNRGR